MGPVSAERTIDAPRERVFALICDMSARPAFCDHFMRDYRIARIPAQGTGAAARFRVAPPGSSTWMDTEIREAEAPYRVSERGSCGRTGRIETATEWELLEGSGAGTTVRVTFWTEPPMAIDRLREHLGAAGWYKRRWRTALRRLGDLAESGRTPERVEAGGHDRAPVAT